MPTFEREIKKILKKYVAFNPEREDTAKWSFIGDNQPLIDDLLSLLSSTVKECLPDKEKTTNKLLKKSYSPHELLDVFLADFEIFGFNQAIDTITKNLKNAGLIDTK